MRGEIKTKDIPGYEGLYYVTPKGEVYRYKKEKPLKIEKRNGRSSYVQLNKNGKHKFFTLTNIMCMCYFGGVKYRFEHKNGDIFDYAYDNLVPRRCDTRNFGLGQRKPVAKIKDGKITFYGSGKDCAEKNYVSQNSICCYCKGKQKARDGAVYMYESEYYKKFGEEYDYHPTR